MNLDDDVYEAAIHRLHCERLGGVVSSLARLGAGISGSSVQSTAESSSELLYWTPTSGAFLRKPLGSLCAHTTRLHPPFLKSCPGRLSQKPMDSLPAPVSGDCPERFAEILGRQQVAYACLFGLAALKSAVPGHVRSQTQKRSVESLLRVTSLDASAVRNFGYRPRSRAGCGIAHLSRVCDRCRRSKKTSQTAGGQNACGTSFNTYAASADQNDQSADLSTRGGPRSCERDSSRMPLRRQSRTRCPTGPACRRTSCPSAQTSP